MKIKIEFSTMFYSTENLETKFPNFLVIFYMVWKHVCEMKFMYFRSKWKLI
jgi:hypothetical protein